MKSSSQEKSPEKFVDNRFGADDSGFRNITLEQASEKRKEVNVAVDHLFDLGTLNFHDDFFTPCEARPRELARYSPPPVVFR
ncbi:unnamed protein product [Sphagnum jensenii]|uniref:Uncharacterized protein n=1 Tax=Sphagnum jensenii TaxID=128206 RepID=A0ABP0V788_9BRYO